MTTSIQDLWLAADRLTRMLTADAPASTEEEREAIKTLGDAVVAAKPEVFAEDIAVASGESAVLRATRVMVGELDKLGSFEARRRAMLATVVLRQLSDARVATVLPLICGGQQ